MHDTWHPREFESRFCKHAASMAAPTTEFAFTPVARRDLVRFTSTCRAPDSAVGFGTRELEDLGHSLSRVLVVDGRCYCKNNGIGNLFGDYVVWFTVAVLSGRALFVDWTNSARSAGEKPLMHTNQTRCMTSGVGYSCPRVPHRFDLAAHFATSSGRVWRWTAKTRAAVVARHGPAAEALLLPERPPNTLTCTEITRRLLGPEAWLTIRTSDETSTAMIPFCLTKMRKKNALAKSEPAKYVQQSWPDRDGVAQMLHAFAGRLHAAGLVRAESELLDAAAYLIVRGRRVSTLWNSPLVLPRPFLTRQRVRSYMLGSPWAAQNSSGAGELPPLSAIAVCAMHAMVRPRRALKAHLAPLLHRIGSSALVTLQLRSGWADDSLYLGPKITKILAQHPSRLPPLIRFHSKHFGHMRLLQPGSAGRAPMWSPELHDHLYGASAAAIASARWNTLTSTPCMTDPTLSDSECLDPSPAFLDAAARSFLLRKPSAKEVSNFRLAHVAAAFRRAVRAPIDLPGANTSKFAKVVRCAAHMAQSIAHERNLVLQSHRHRGSTGADEDGVHDNRVGVGGSGFDINGELGDLTDTDANDGNGDGGGGGGGGGTRADDGGSEGWKLYVSSDSPGMRSTLEALPGLRGHVLGCYPRGCSDAALHAGQWRTPSAAEGLALATDLWMFGAADAAIAGSATTLTYWASRAPPRDGRQQLVKAMGQAAVLGNKMVPVCAPPAGQPKCFDAEPNYERFPHKVLKSALSERDSCFAMRFSLMSESAAHAIEQPEVLEPTAYRTARANEVRRDKSQ